MADAPRITVTERHGRRCAGSGSPFEPVIGYARAVRSGDFIAVSGTVGINPDGTYPPTAGEQARRALAIARAAIEALGGRLQDVIRTRIFVADIARDNEAVGRAHGEVFGEIRPACTMVQAKLISDAALVEIELDAIV